MIVYDNISETLVRAYSNKNVMIADANGDTYIDAIDPINLHRTYVETDIPIEPEPEYEATIEDYQNALQTMGVKLDEEE